MYVLQRAAEDEGRGAEIRDPDSNKGSKGGLVELRRFNGESSSAEEQLVAR